MILVEAECSLVWLYSRERGVAKDGDREREGKGKRERDMRERSGRQGRRAKAEREMTYRNCYD